MHDSALLTNDCMRGMPAGHVKLPEERSPQVHMGSIMGVLIRLYCWQGSLRRKGDCTGQHTLYRQCLRGWCFLQMTMIPSGASHCCASELMGSELTETEQVPAS